MFENNFLLAYIFHVKIEQIFSFFLVAQTNFALIQKIYRLLETTTMITPKFLLCFVVCFNQLLQVTSQECQVITTTTTKNCGENNADENLPTSQIARGKKGPKGFSNKSLIFYVYMCFFKVLYSKYRF